VIGATAKSWPKPPLKWPPGGADNRDVAVVIKADCPECGVVRLGTEDVTVRVCADDGSGAYSFHCVGCGLAVSHPARQDVVELLTRAGCKHVEWRLPDELGEHRGGPSFTTDDLLDFHLLLRGDAWHDELQRLVSGVDHFSG
jgi:hypothetical protein